MKENVGIYLAIERLHTFGLNLIDATDFVATAIVHSVLTDGYSEELILTYPNISEYVESLAVVYRVDGAILAKAFVIILTDKEFIQEVKDCYNLQ